MTLNLVCILHVYVHCITTYYYEDMSIESIDSCLCVLGECCFQETLFAQHDACKNYIDNGCMDCVKIDADCNPGVGFPTHIKRQNDKSDTKYHTRMKKAREIYFDPDLRNFKPLSEVSRQHASGYTIYYKMAFLSEQEVTSLFSVPPKALKLAGITDLRGWKKRFWIPHEAEWVAIGNHSHMQKSQSLEACSVQSD